MDLEKARQLIPQFLTDDLQDDELQSFREFLESSEELKKVGMYVLNTIMS